MKDEKPLTKSDLLSVLKEAGIPTEERLVELVDETVHNRMTEFYAGMIKPEQDNMRKEIVSRLEAIDTKLAELQVEVRGVKDDTRGINAELSLTVSRKDFDELRTRVDKYHPQF